MGLWIYGFGLGDLIDDALEGRVRRGNVGQRRRNATLVASQIPDPLTAPDPVPSDRTSVPDRGRGDRLMLRPRPFGRTPARPCEQKRTQPHHLPGVCALEPAQRTLSRTPPPSRRL